MNSESEESYKSQVLLNVYDLTPINGYVYWFGFGIFHSGIEGRLLGFNTQSHNSQLKYQILSGVGRQQVHGMEYGYGAHEYPASGVFEVEPRSCPGFVFRRSILLGYTTMPPAEFRTFLEHMASEYHGDTYHLISKNCNHFTEDLSLRLTGEPIPGWVNRLARLGTVCSCLLPESLQVSAVKQLPEYHGGSEDESESHSANAPTESDEAGQDKHFLLSSAGEEEVAFIKEAQR